MLRSQYVSLLVRNPSLDSLTIIMNDFSTRPPTRARKKVSRWMFGLMWLGVLVFLTVFFDDYLQKQFNPNEQVQSRANGLVTEVTLQRNRYGHYVTNGIINGHEVTFLLDTGATDVAIPETIAQELQLAYGRKGQAITANGMSDTFDTTLDAVGIGGISLNNIPAAIIPSYQSDAILLGMSFLKHIEFTQRGDTLILRK